MKILIDECLPAGLKETVTALGHECETVRRAGYGSKKNGELLSLAEGRWEVLLTGDRRIKHQQNVGYSKRAQAPHMIHIILHSGNCTPFSNPYNFPDSLGISFVSCILRTWQIEASNLGSCRHS